MFFRFAKRSPEGSAVLGGTIVGLVPHVAMLGHMGKLSVSTETVLVTDHFLLVL